MSSLNLFPIRVPTGRFRGPDGKDIDVYATPEFFRALSDVFARLGGVSGVSNDELSFLVNQAIAPTESTAARDAIDELQFLQAPDQSGLIASLMSRIDALQAAQSEMANLAGEIAAIRKQINTSTDEGLFLASYSDPFRLDWERPGKIGFSTPNTGKFTTLTATAAVSLSPASSNVVMSPTGTGVVTIAPATAGSINNMNIGAATAGTIRGTTVTATGAFGCNGTVAQTAFASGGALGAYVAGANGLDTGANMSALHAMVVAIRAALVADGIMS